MRPHGTYAKYVLELCRCEPCTRANREYMRDREERQRNGTSLFVPAEPVRERVRRLVALGMTHDEIARVAGLNDCRLSDLMTGHWRTGRPLTRMKRENAERIMAVQTRNPKPGANVTMTDAPEMVLDLMEMGYSAPWIAHSIGLSYQGRAALLRTSHRASTYTALKRLHSTTTTPAPTSPEASRSRNFALHTRRVREMKRGGTVTVDAERIFAAIEGDMLAFTRDTGIDKAQLYRIRERGSCDYYTLDLIAVALNRHPDTFVVEVA